METTLYTACDGVVGWRWGGVERRTSRWGGAEGERDVSKAILIQR